MKCFQIVLFGTFKCIFCIWLIYHQDLGVLSISLRKQLPYIVCFIPIQRTCVISVAKRIY